MVVLSRRRARAAALALAALSAASGARAADATIRGRVEVRREPAASSTRPNVADLGPARAPDGDERKRSVVYLEAAPHGAFEDSERARVVLDQRNQTFVPHVLAIQAGTNVDFPNNDQTYHNVFSLSRAKRFDLGRYPKNQVRTVRFERPGVVRVFCDIHSHMSAFILVFAHRYFATTDEGGAYRIEGVPAGSYRLVAWNDGQEREVRTVEVPAGGTVEADFALK
ncbi:MAG: carboxypeptidase regulatory-like domain-containing protein [Vicinamibacteria bacterium]